ncbi:MAG: YkgJ family cysteine cluster protein [Planctomycetota bacterium]|jgi:Fe-S-cluster containining protein
MSSESWWTNGLRFECQQCGYCCSGEPGYVWLTEEELHTIARYCGMSASEFRKKSVRRIRRKHSLREHNNGDCLMFHPERGCLVYPVRPAQCRTYPFWSHVLKSRKTWKSEGKKCPGIGNGPKRKPETIMKKLSIKW